MKAVIVDRPGGADVLRLADVQDPVAGPDEMLIRVAAAGVNRADVLQRMGFYPPPPGASDILGLEISGVVEVAARSGGPDAGARVVALIEGGGYAELASARWRQVVPVPNSVDLVAAASIPEVFITAHSNLFGWGRLQSGEAVLIHGGAGGVGTAAIQLAHQRQCAVVTTAGAERKLARCRELGADVTINHRSEDFVARVHEVTHGRGVDVILDVMGAEYLERNIEALAPAGRLVIIGMQGGTHADLDIARLNRKCATVMATQLRAQPAEQKATLVAAFADEVMPLIADGMVRPVVDRVLPLHDAADAHRALESGEVIGKVLLQVNDAL
ncbi:MAG: NAD(P)H-quinone oxidoreductase [Candidatus Dormibacteraeota bacterium]|nr:NAD(P)H-quinone oxidoreductase [Candidatus Dormibacteraeota bacterium]